MNTCINCFKETINPKFCSRSCAASFNNSKYPKRKPSHKCKGCSNFVTKNVFCSLDCRQSYILSKTKPKVKINKPKEATRAKKYRDNLKQKAIDYKGGKCIYCGYSKCNRSLDFHHRIPKDKEFGIGGKKVSWERMKVELDKCDLVCRNCHGELHAGIIGGHDET